MSSMPFLVPAGRARVILFNSTLRSSSGPVWCAPPVLLRGGSLGVSDGSASAPRLGLLGVWRRVMVSDVSRVSGRDAGLGSSGRPPGPGGVAFGALHVITSLVRVSLAGLVALGGGSRLSCLSLEAALGEGGLRPLLGEGLRGEDLGRCPRPSLGGGLGCGRSSCRPRVGDLARSRLLASALSLSLLSCSSVRPCGRSGDRPRGYSRRSEGCRWSVCPLSCLPPCHLTGEWVRLSSTGAGALWCGLGSANSS